MHVVWHADSQRTDVTGGRGQLVVDEGSEPPVVVTEPGTQAGTGTHT